MKTKILYEDDTLWVVYKPAGLAVQSANVTQKDLVSELKATSAGGYVGLVHRLDQPVEGLLAVGKTKRATAALSGQLADGGLGKEYCAVVCAPESLPALTTGREVTLTDFMRKAPGAKAAEIVTENYAADCHKKSCDKRILENGTRAGSRPDRGDMSAKPQKAVLTYRITATADCPVDGKKLALVNVYIQTGRFHQIRAQMAHASLPLLGDQKYAPEEIRLLSQKLQVRSVALCAYKMSFRHPVTKKELSFQIRPEGEIFDCFQMTEL